ncbi:MAG: hypothetical protein WC700_09005 [Gemmatimonadaceae bacterium]|jgi:hypothetical protein
MRLRGEDTSLSILVDNQVQTQLGDVKSANLTWEMEIKEEGFLGEHSDRYDTVYKGITGDLDIQIEDASWTTFVQSLLDIAQRRTPGVSLQVVSKQRFTNGTSRTIIVPDPSFGAIPLATPARGDYVTVKLNYKASQAIFV